MALEHAGAKTWLLGAIALWALCFWALALFGAGGRIEALDDDPAMLARLPQGVPAAAERLGPLPQYAEIGTRPPFSPNRQPQPFVINPDPEGDAAPSFDFVLTSVLLTPRLQMAILQPAEGGDSVRLKIGEAPDATPGWVLASLAERSAVFNGPDGERTLALRVFDGIGGEPPTELAIIPPMPTPPENPPATVGRPPGANVARPPAATLPLTANRSATATSPQAALDGTEPPETADAAAQRTSAAQIEAIRKRIEARRAQLRQQAQQPPPPAPAENP